mgnify:CR=1 FL=1
MRDIVAALLAAMLILVSLSLATSLHWDRLRRNRRRGEMASRGQTILAEIPAETGLKFFTEDAGAFHYGDLTIRKKTIRAVQVLINGIPIASSVVPSYTGVITASLDILENRPDGLARDRWDVSIETEAETILIQCGAIRERISQELARRIFGAVKIAMESEHQ